MIWQCCQPININSSQVVRIIYNYWKYYCLTLENDFNLIIENTLIECKRFKENNVSPNESYSLKPIIEMASLVMGQATSSLGLRGKDY